MGPHRQDVELFGIGGAHAARASGRVAGSDTVAPALVTETTVARGERGHEPCHRITTGEAGDGKDDCNE